MADVFISYARDERERADQIKVALQDLGLSVFLDVEGLDGGDVFSDVLDREVKTSGAVLGLWSPHALSRPWVRIECQIARDRGVLVPAVIEPIDAIRDVPAMFYGIQHIDLSEFDGDVTDENWLKLVKALARTLERPELLTRAAGELTGGLSGGGEANADLRNELAQLRAELNAIRTQADAIPMKQTQTTKGPSPLVPVLLGVVAVAALAGFWMIDPLKLQTPKAPEPVRETLQEQLASGKIALGKPTPLSEIQGGAPLSDEAQRVLDQAAAIPPAHSDLEASAETLTAHSKACEAGNGEQCYLAGRQYEIGLGVDRDEKQAAKYYDKACRLDHAAACSSAAAMIIRAEIVTRAGVEKAEAYYRQACKLGEKASCKSP